MLPEKAIAPNLFVSSAATKVKLDIKLKANLLFIMVRLVAKRSVVVHVGGQRYVVRSGADEAYIQKLAEYVDERLKEVQSSSKPASTPSLTMLAALNIADELFQERKKGLDLKKRVRDKSRAMIAMVDKEVKARLEPT